VNDNNVNFQFPITVIVMLVKHGTDVFPVVFLRLGVSQLNQFGLKTQVLVLRKERWLLTLVYLLGPPLIVLW